MKREKFGTSSSPVTIKLKSNHFQTLDGKSIDGVVVWGTWVDFLKNNFKSTTNEIVDFDKVYVMRSAIGGQAGIKHSVDEEIWRLLDMEYVYRMSSYTITVTCESKTIPLRMALRNRLSEASKCSTCDDETCSQKIGSHLKPSRDNSTRFQTKKQTLAVTHNRVGISAKYGKRKASEMDQGIFGGKYKYDEETLFNFNPKIVKTSNRESDEESQGSQDSQDALDEAGIEIETIKESVLGSIGQRTNNTQLLFIRDEIRKLRGEAKWHRFSSKAPTLGNWLLDIFFPN